MTSAHLVEVIDKTAGVRLVCHTCPWTASLDTGTGLPATGAVYAQLRHEAGELAQLHRWQTMAGLC